MDRLAPIAVAPRRPRFAAIEPPPAEAPRRELMRGLRAAPASIEPKYLSDRLGLRLFGAICDRLGSRLFGAICKLPAPYLWRAEGKILEVHGAEIAVGESCALIDLGAGNCRKAERLLDLLPPAHYGAGDICGE